jgi:uncharacterized surface protein with fasciclin (FAS1) repeats
VSMQTRTSWLAMPLSILLLVSTSVTDADPMINDAVITAVDIRTSNGIVHVIDKVLVPAGLL